MLGGAPWLPAPSSAFRAIIGDYPSIEQRHPCNATVLQTPAPNSIAPEPAAQPRQQADNPCAAGFMLTGINNYGDIQS